MLSVAKEVQVQKVKLEANLPGLLFQKWKEFAALWWVTEEEANTVLGYQGVHPGVCVRVRVRVLFRAAPVTYEGS